MRGLTSGERLLQLGDRASNPYGQPPDKRYRLSVVEEYEPRRDHVVLNGPEQYQLGTLCLQPGIGALTVTKDGVPFIITDGLDAVCSSLLDVVRQDREWKRIGRKMEVVVQTSILSCLASRNSTILEKERSTLNRGLLQLGLNYEQFEAMSKAERAKLIQSYLTPLRAAHAQQPTVGVETSREGFEYLSGIQHNGQRIFDLRFVEGGYCTPDMPLYSSWCSDGLKLIRALRACTRLTRR